MNASAVRRSSGQALRAASSGVASADCCAIASAAASAGVASSAGISAISGSASNKPRGVLAVGEVAAVAFDAIVARLAGGEMKTDSAARLITGVGTVGSMNAG